MRTSLPTLDNITVASPCPAAWESMAGDEHVRHCGQCDKNVYDLSGLTAEEARQLIRDKEGQVCIRFFRRSDGTILTSDCPEGIRLKRSRRLRRAILVASATGAIAYGISSLVEPTMGKPCMGEPTFGPGDNRDLELLPPPREVPDPEE